MSNECVCAWVDRALSKATDLESALQANGYAGVAVLSSDNQLVTASATKDRVKRVVDVDPLTGIILAHVALPPLPAQTAPITGLPANPR